jgi:hypothetical protein
VAALSLSVGRAARPFIVTRGLSSYERSNHGQTGLAGLPLYLLADRLHH